MLRLAPCHGSVFGMSEGGRSEFPEPSGWAFAAFNLSSLDTNPRLRRSTYSLLRAAGASSEVNRMASGSPAFVGAAKTTCLGKSE